MATKTKSSQRDDDFGGWLAERYGSMSKAEATKSNVQKKPAEKKQATTKATRKTK